MAWMVKLSDDLGLPVSFTMLQIDAAPDAWRGLMDESLRAYDAGAQVVPQVAARPFGMLLGFPTRHGFSGRPTYRALAARLGPDELLAELAKPAVRAQILAEDDVAPDPTVLFDGFFQLVQGSLDRLYSLGDPPVYEPTPDRTIAAMAEAAGVARSTCSTT